PLPRADGPPVLPMPEPAKKIEPVKNETPLFPGLPGRVELGTPPPLLPVGNASVENALPLQAPQSKPPVPVSEPLTRPAVPYQLINTTHATLDYRIDQVGPSGVGKVEIYL